ncbi:MAG TPA: hypothetical protein H9846_02875 [Candidatus Gemmiger excrementipullorum]|uniref:Uncharacterized protein n=1 Tax=Candidatus Gemmiger excrementipullorum TaxID=2838610 RepID=A0A9D1Y2V4_9FIRM|nr:hypothetical protein [Candidatus Gemmiger excrementipullorum]
MTYSEKKAWLSRYQISLKREKVLEDEIEVLRSRACRVTPALTGMPGGPSDGQSLPRAVESIQQAQQDLRDQIAQCESIRREIVEVIAHQVTDPLDNEILCRRYLCGQKWEKIAVELNYAYQYVCQRHKRAIAKLLIESYIDQR